MKTKLEIGTITDVEQIIKTKNLKQLPDTNTYISSDGKFVLSIYDINDDIYRYHTKTIDTENINLSNCGYILTSIGNKVMTLHKAVALAWLPNPDNKKFINHIDGNKRNCSVENLEWTTHSDNMKHAWANGLISGHPKKEVQYFNGKIRDYRENKVYEASYAEYLLLRKKYGLRITSNMLKLKAKYNIKPINKTNRIMIKQ